MSINPRSLVKVPLDLIAPPSNHPTGAILLSALGDIDGFAHTDLDQPSASGMYNPSHGNAWTIDVAWLKPYFVVRTHAGSPSASFAVDGGYNWTTFARTPSGATGESPIAVSADASVIMWRGSWSNDNGTTWTASTGLPSGSGGSNGENPVADRVDPLKFYTGTFA